MTLVPAVPRTLRLAALMGFAVLSLPSSPRAEENAPAGLAAWMPGDVIAFAQLRDAGKTARELMGSELRKRVEATAVFRFLKEEPNARKLFKGLDEFRQAAGRSALDVAEDLLGVEALAGVRLGFPPAVMVIARSRSAEALKAGVESLRELARRHAGGNAPSFGRLEREGVVIESIDSKVAFALVDEHLFISNSLSAVEEMLALSKGKGGSPLAASSAFAGAFAGPASPAPLFRAAALPRFVPGFRIPERADNPLASLLFSGWMEVLRSSDLITARLDRAERGLRLAFESRAAEGKQGAKLSSTFYPESSGAADLTALETRGVLGYVHINRDFGQWWNQKDAYLDADAGEQLLQANNVLTVFFGGTSFEDEVLPELAPGFTLVARNLSYAGLAARPRPQIPGFAGIFRLKHPEKLGQKFISAFQSLITIINFDRAQKGQGAAFTLNLEKVGEVNFFTAELNLPPESKAKPGGIETNFSPCLAVVGPRVVLASSKEFGKQLVEELGSAAASGASGAAASGAAVDSFRIQASTAKQLLVANLEFLADKMVLDEGISAEEAKGRLTAIAELVDLLEGLSIQTRHSKGVTALDVELGFSGGAPTTQARGQGESARAKQKF
jgi:hypothetical protein